MAPTSPRLPEPRIDDDVTGAELDRAVRRELRTLSRDNAAGVAAHLVMVGRLLDDDLEGARAHAETAVRRAGRVAAARETLGLVEYRSGRWAQALAEFRTARRIAGDQHLLPLMVDCERALGRPERALELASGPEAQELTAAEKVELRIVVSGIRRDLGRLDAAALELRNVGLDPSARKPWSGRLFYAYADVLLAQGDEAAARTWFAHAVDADTELETDAAERLDELDGIVLTDLLGDEEDEDDEGDDVAAAVPAGGPPEGGADLAGPVESPAGAARPAEVTRVAGDAGDSDPGVLSPRATPEPESPASEPDAPASPYGLTWSDPQQPVATGRAGRPGARLELSDAAPHEAADAPGSGSGSAPSRWSRAAPATDDSAERRGDDGSSGRPDAGEDPA
ncbi:hypothetical protein [Agilicoccus flavus]|uniref:hypothetical protein n=1 Tax=Agilicoccus flavus TaxID=2775968 RepID=UPI001CF68876|nr:hypothetical protein [Agilicoccus flavus]